MKIGINFQFDRASARASLVVTMSNGQETVVRSWQAPGRAFTVAELDDVWAALAGELDVQQVLGPVG